MSVQPQTLKDCIESTYRSFFLWKYGNKIVLEFLVFARLPFTWEHSKKTEKGMKDINKEIKK
jgi:hypothetical protein